MQSGFSVSRSWLFFGLQFQGRLSELTQLANNQPSHLAPYPGYLVPPPARHTCSERALSLIGTGACGSWRTRGSKPTFLDGQTGARCHCAGVTWSADFGAARLALGRAASRGDWTNVVAAPGSCVPLCVGPKLVVQYKKNIYVYIFLN